MVLKVEWVGVNIDSAGSGTILTSSKNNHGCVAQIEWFPESSGFYI